MRVLMQVHPESASRRVRVAWTVIDVIKRAASGA